MSNNLYTTMKIFLMVGRGGFSVPGSILIITGALTFINRTPFCYPFMCPFCVLSKLGKCLRMRVVVRLCHVA